jgi:hypothetical protein
MQKALRIFLLILIIIGIILLFTQKIWVPKLVNIILLSETSSQPASNLNINNNSQKTDPIRLDTPSPNQIISSPLAISGVARGSWFFEAKLTFTVDKKAYSNKGTLILRKDNPSGLSKNDDSFEIPVIFAGIKGNATPSVSGQD